MTTDQHTAYHNTMRGIMAAVEAEAHGQPTRAILDNAPAESRQWIAANLATYAALVRQES